MVVEVLHPQEPQGLLTLPTNYHHRNPNPPSNRRKPQRKPARSNSTSPVHKPPVQLSGPVKILKRGEDLPISPPKQSQNSPDLKSPPRSGSIAPKKQTGRVEPVRPNPALKFYAGPSSSIASPPPSSLPLPSFFAKKGSVVSSPDEAASGILKLLGLNLS